MVGQKFPWRLRASLHRPARRNVSLVQINWHCIPLHIDPLHPLTGADLADKMRSALSLLLFYLASVVTALSAVGSRLLVVLEDSAEKEKYTQFLGDLECKELRYHNRPNGNWTDANIQQQEASKSASNLQKPTNSPSSTLANVPTTMSSSFHLSRRHMVQL